jgi:hypothetical protein
MSAGFHVIATPSALSAAERLGLDGVLENETERAILRGRVHGQGVERRVALDDGLVARVRRLDEWTGAGRRKLLVMGVEPARTTDNGRRRS